MLSLDADERNPPALQAEVREAIATGRYDGFRIPRSLEFRGHVMHYNGWHANRTAVAHTLFAFVRTSLLKLGFLDGRHELMLAIYNAEYAYYTYEADVHPESTHAARVRAWRHRQASIRR